MYSKKLSLMYSDLSLSVDNSFSNIAMPSDLLSGFKNLSINPFDHTPAFDWMKNTDFEVGTQLHEEGLEAEFPVILIPVSLEDAVKHSDGHDNGIGSMMVMEQGKEA